MFIKSFSTNLDAWYFYRDARLLIEQAYQSGSVQIFSHIGLA